MRQPDDRTTISSDSNHITALARGALERVCSGKGLDPAATYYSPTFVDHVNDMEFHGLEGTQHSIELYKSVLDELDVRVEEQLAQGARVMSRFVVTGRSGNRRVRFNGITVSRFEHGRIVEDWSVTDTLSLLRQLGPWRSLLLGIRTWRTIKGRRILANH